MNKEEIQKLIRETINDSTNTSQYAVSNSALHTHNGIDTQKINAKNLIYNNKLLTGITASNENTILTLNQGIFNPTSILLYGIARNNLAGAAIKKTTITGNAQLGNCFLQTATNPALATSLDVNSYSRSVVQGCSGTIFDNTSGAWVPSVFTVSTGFTTGTGFLNEYIATASTDFTLATLSVISFDQTSITFHVVVAADWRLTCNLIIT